MNHSNPFDDNITPLQPIPTDLTQQGLPKQKIRGILFDIYGTLFISGSGDIGVAEKQAEENQGLETLLKKYAITTSPAHLKQRLFSEIEATHARLRQEGVDFPEVEVDKIWMAVLNFSDIEMARAFARDYEAIVNPVYPMPHLRELLEKLKACRMPMGIISNAQFYTPELFPRFLSANTTDLGFRPDLIFYSYMCAHAKPSLFMFRTAVKHLHAAGISPGSIVYIGNDMLNDILPAHEVGFQTALFAGDKRSLRLRQDDPRVADLAPDIVITDLIQLLDCL